MRVEQESQKGRRKYYCDADRSAAICTKMKKAVTWSYLRLNYVAGAVAAAIVEMM